MKTIQEILEAEKKAENILKQAERNKAKKVAKARERALESINKAKKEAEKQMDTQIKQKMAKFEQHKKKIVHSYAERAQKIKKEAEKNIGKAASLVLKKLLAEAQ